MKAKFETEAAMAALVVTWLTQNRWEVYQEVAIKGVDGPCDIVAVRGRVVWAIECKLSMNLDVLGQAHRWVNYAHIASVAVPRLTRSSSTHRVTAKILRLLGAGCLEVCASNQSVREDVSPRFCRPRHDLRKHLHEQQKTIVAAGGNRGGYWTPFKQTCHELLKVVQEKPGIELRDALKATKHHYSTDASARACLLDLASKGIVPGIRLEKDGKKITVHLAKEKAATHE